MDLGRCDAIPQRMPPPTARQHLAYRYYEVSAAKTCRDQELSKKLRGPADTCTKDCLLHNTDSHSTMPRVVRSMYPPAGWLLTLLLATSSSACSTRHWVSDATKGARGRHCTATQTHTHPPDRQGITLSINYLASAHALHRFKDYAAQSLPALHHTLNRSTVEVTVALEAGMEDPSHAKQLPGVDNLLYLSGSNLGHRFAWLVNHVGQLSSCSVEWFGTLCKHARNQ